MRRKIASVENDGEKDERPLIVGSPTPHERYVKIQASIRKINDRAMSQFDLQLRQVYDPQGVEGL